MALNELCSNFAAQCSCWKAAVYDSGVLRLSHCSHSLGTCPAEVHRSLLHLHDELNEGKVIILLTYPWLWMNGCVPVGMLKVLGVTLCCATCGIFAYGKDFCSARSKNRANRAALSRQISCPEHSWALLQFQSEMWRWRQELQSQLQNSISCESLWRGKITASCNTVGMQDMKWLPQRYTHGRAKN